MDQFSLDISKFVEKAKGRIDTVVRKITLDVFSSVINMSPVDTGRFRGNWISYIGSYKSEIIDAFDKTGSETINKVTQVINQSKSGGFVYLVNSLPYAQRLEYGYSNQAANGMVRVTLANYQGYVRNAARA